MVQEQESSNWCSGCCRFDECDSEYSFKYCRKQLISDHLPKQMKTKAETNRKYFIRLQVEDVPGAMKEVVSVFADYHVSMEKILQMPLKGTNKVDFVVVTHHATLQSIEDTLEALKNTKIVSKIESAYRIVGEKK